MQHLREREAERNRVRAVQKFAARVKEISRSDRLPATEATVSSGAVPVGITDGDPASPSPNKVRKRAVTICAFH